MRGVFSRIGIWLLAACAAGGLAHAAAAADVQALRVWSGPEYTRVVFDLSGPLDYKLFQLASPDRVVLDLDGSRFADAFKAPAAKGLIKSVRAGKRGNDGARVVFDLSESARPKSFLLKPTDEYGYRLVLDLYGAAKAMPAVAKRIDDALPGKPRKVVVAIDAGHGGDDPGAKGASGTYEKNVTLAVARELAGLIDRQPGMKAVLTRDGDYFIPLKRRYQIARENKADLFVSIHADAFSSSDARGSSVWVLSPRGAGSEASRWLADRENRADLVGGVSLDDKDDTLASVLLDLSQGYTMEASNAVANDVLKALAKLGPTHRGYVERANFVVLRSPDVPSVLVETAFITNPVEEKKLKSPEHREQLAQAILQGVRNYFQSTPPPGTLFAYNAGREPPAPAPQQVAARGAGSGGNGGASGNDADSAQALHRVLRGETLSGIAQEYGVSLDELRSANRIDGDVGLRAGAVLVIPAS